MESDDEVDTNADSYTERDMKANSSSKVLKQFDGTYDIFEKMDFFKKPEYVEIQDPNEFLKCDQDEEALEILEQAMMFSQTPRAI